MNFDPFKRQWTKFVDIFFILGWGYPRPSEGYLGTSDGCLPPPPGSKVLWTPLTISDSRGTCSRDTRRWWCCSRAPRSATRSSWPGRCRPGRGRPGSRRRWRPSAAVGRRPAPGRNTGMPRMNSMMKNGTRNAPGERRKGDAFPAVVFTLGR